MTNLLVSEVFPPRTGGSGRWFWEVYSRMPREQVAVVAGTCEGDLEFDAEHDLNLVRENLSFDSWGIVGLAKGRRYWRTHQRIRQFARQHRAVAVHCGKCLPEGLLGLMLKSRDGLPLLTYVHGEELSVARSSRELVWLTRRVLHGSNLVIANSHHTEALLLDDWKVPRDRLSVLHPGVDTARFVPTDRLSAASVAARARLGWADRTVVLTVGRLQARKGHDHLIQSLKTIRREVPNVLYAIVGEGEERSRLEQLVASEGVAQQVRMHGELRDAELTQCYQQCDLFALPNRQVGKDFEGFGMVLLEAQACGRPVLAGTSGGTAETMRVPETGRLVDCNRPEPLADALLDLLSNRTRLEQMGQAARQWVVERFDWGSLTARASELFAELLEPDADIVGRARARRAAQQDSMAGIHS